MSKLASMFQERYLPHWAMLVLTILWLYFQISLHGNVPGTIQQGFTFCLAAWFPYLLRERKTAKEDKDKEGGNV